jgi:hypothetical protein
MYWITESEDGFHTGDLYYQDRALTDLIDRHEEIQTYEFINNLLSFAYYDAAGDNYGIDIQKKIAPVYNLLLNQDIEKLNVIAQEQGLPDIHRIDWFVFNLTIHLYDIHGNTIKVHFRIDDGISLDFYTVNTRFMTLELKKDIQRTMGVKELLLLSR